MLWSIRNRCRLYIDQLAGVVGHRIEETSGLGVRHCKQRPTLDPNELEYAVMRECVNRKVGARLEPIRHAVCPLEGAVERALRHDSAGRPDDSAPVQSVVGVNGKIEFARRFNLSIVDLDLVRLST